MAHDASTPAEPRTFIRFKFTNADGEARDHRIEKKLAWTYRIALKKANCTGITEEEEVE